MQKLSQKNVMRPECLHFNLNIYTAILIMEIFEGIVG